MHKFHGWRTVPLEEIVSIKHGFAFKSEYFTDEGAFALLTPGNFHENGGFRKLGSKQKFFSGLFPKQYLLNKGQLLVVMTEQASGLLGSTLAVPEDGKYLHNQRLGLIEISDKKAVTGEFLLHFFNSSLLRKPISDTASGTKVRHTSPSKILEIPITLPPLAEQKLIAKILSGCDRAVSITNRLIAAKQERRTWLMRQILTGKRRLQGFGGDWKEVEIGNLFREVNRPVEWDDDELYPLISVRRRSGGLFHRESLFGRQILTKNLKTARAGDFLISKMQVLHGATGMVTPEFDGMKISGSYISLVPRKPVGISTEFFNYYSQLPSFYHVTFLASLGVHIEKMTFDVNWFMKSKVYVPPTIEEQAAIVKFLKGTDRELDLLLTQLDALREQKKGLMQQLLTGKIRVKVPC